MANWGFGIWYQLSSQETGNYKCRFWFLGFEATEKGMINFGVLCLQLLTLITFEA
jgi:hypothetical protein